MGVEPGDSAPRDHVLAKSIIVEMKTIISPPLSLDPARRGANVRRRSVAGESVGAEIWEKINNNCHLVIMTDRSPFLVTFIFQSMICHEERILFIIY